MVLLPTRAVRTSETYNNKTHCFSHTRCSLYGAHYIVVSLGHASILRISFRSFYEKLRLEQAAGDGGGFTSVRETASCAGANPRRTEASGAKIVLKLRGEFKPFNTNAAPPAPSSKVTVKLLKSGQDTSIMDQVHG